MYVDGVFSGGGVKAFAYLGALEVLEENQIEFKRLAGTSAGALVAALVTAGYTANELEHIFQDLHPKELLDESPWFKKVPFLKWLNIYFRMGIYRGDKLEEWLTELLWKKGIHTFADIEEDQLHIIGTDLTNGRITVFPNDLHNYYGIDPTTFPVARAVRISVSIPYFFQPVILPTKSRYRSVLVDGGVLSNFPYWIFKPEENQSSERPVLGVKLSSSDAYIDKAIPARTIDNALNMLDGLFQTLIRAHDARYISNEDAKNIIFIPIDQVNATDFHLDEDEKNYLLNLGRSKAKAFLKKRGYLE
ncbi:patatin-like phospholipase family protein [Alkalibacillus aidingensis]|uniref:patatin-like phospholipase family protein n=1 Tax=Alkalibacillus aidingensis TaxID=2747607 RepID=UPI0016606581|nr:patatin-like phospholipase family protein [Alkalibacillus aidingensis]